MGDCMGCLEPFFLNPKCVKMNRKIAPYQISISPLGVINADCLFDNVVSVKTKLHFNTKGMTHEYLLKLILFRVGEVDQLNTLKAQ